MAWYIWMEGGRPHLGFGRHMEEAKRNDVSKNAGGLSGGDLGRGLVSPSAPFLPADESWLRSEIEKLEQERRNLGISHEET